MSNRQGRYNKLEVERSGLPVYIPRSSRWTKNKTKDRNTGIKIFFINIFSFNMYLYVV